MSFSISDRSGSAAIRWLDEFRGDRGATRCFHVALVVGGLILLLVARRQWFEQDDWAYLLWRDHLREAQGIEAWLMTPHNGHWVAIPALHYSGAKTLFGMSSYWPYVLPSILLHVTATWMGRTIAVRSGVTGWTATALACILLVFGSGEEFIAFAAITSWTLSLNAFLAQLLLLDHDGGRLGRDVLAAGLGVLGTASSGFGPFFALGVAVWLVVQRRYRTISIVVVPQLVAFAWWWLTWGRDQAAERVPGPRSIAPAFAVRGVTAALDGLLSIPPITGITIVVAAVAAFVLPHTRRERAFLWALGSAAATMYVGVGIQRAGFGVDSAASGRYVAMGAFLLMPMVGLAADQLRSLAPRAVWVAYAIAVVSVAVNVGKLQIVTSERGASAHRTREVFELVAGSAEFPDADPMLRPDSAAPDVQLVHFPELIEEGAFSPREPSTPEELAIVRQALQLDE